MNKVTCKNNHFDGVKCGKCYPPLKLLKKDFSSVPFSEKKILISILKAALKTSEFDTVIATELLTKVLEELSLLGDELINTSDVRVAVQSVLNTSNYSKTSKCYEDHGDISGKSLTTCTTTYINPIQSVDEYLKHLDWRVNANANQSYSLGGLILNSSGKMIANYWLDEVYTNEISQAHRKGELHIHDLDMLAGYCAGWSLRNLLNQGLNNVSDKISSAPPKHLSSAVGQIVNFLGIMQNEWAGAQAFSSFDTYLAPYIRRDKMFYKQVKQAMQEMIFGLNMPSRWGTQTPFTNLTFDWVCPEDLKDVVPTIAGEEMPFRYGELQEEMNLINQAFIELMLEGDVNGRSFTFPIPTYNITDDFNWDSKNAELLFELTAKYGTPYFQNFINSDLKPNMIRSMCCRLQLDLRELLKRGNGIIWFS
jgi:anaerobic ribonucleoside-triphosphate reductase